ncbi:hypothetical protein [Streptomyces sp. NPDC090057]|uniref:lipase/acyltransferase domain-containing protein n=1 Tax=Streptomyces sp. NPDC090057 TaxID=3365935 RepID=UPI0037F945D2
MLEEHRTRDLVVVVPGILGSVLHTPDGRPAWDVSLALGAHLLRNFCEVLDTLRLPPGLGYGPPPAEFALCPTGLMGGLQVWPGFWKGAGYLALRDALRECLRDPDQQLMFFPYDWRLSNRYNARLLRDRVEQRLDEWRRGDGGSDAQLQLICHSMGGLIGRYFLHVLGGQEMTRRAYTLGTPYSGSVKAVRVLTGRLLPSPVSGLGERLRDIATTFPSIAELLPTYACVTEPGSTAATPLADHHLPDLDPQAVEHSTAFHREIHEAEAASPHDLVHVFAGGWQPTEQAVLIDGPELRFHRLQRGADFAGDGTVPRFSSVPPHWKDDAHVLLYPAKHVGLPSNKHVLRDLTRRINTVPLSEALTPQRRLSLHLPSVALADRAVPLRVRTDSPQLLLDAHVRTPKGTPTGPPIPLLADGTGTYTADLALPPGTWHIVVTTPRESPASSVEDLVVVAQY